MIYITYVYRILLIASILFFPGMIMSQPLKIDSSWVRKNAYEIKSVDLNENYKDLEFLKEKIGDSRFVLLGEMDHGDGTTIEAKGRLIKYLYQELGFEVLIVEDDFYGVKVMWDSLITPKSKSKDLLEVITNQSGALLFQSEKPLDDFIIQSLKNKNPLIVQGLDMGPGGTYGMRYDQDIRRYFEGISEDILKTKEWKAFYAILRKIMYESAKSFSKKDLDNLERTGEFLIGKLRSNGDHIENKIFEQTIKNLYIRGRFSIELKQGAKFEQNRYDFYHYADYTMAQNVEFIANVMYPKKKIIISAATFHTSRNVDSIRRIEDEWKEGKVFGEYFSAKHKHESYSIAFIRHHGITGRLFINPDGSKLYKGTTVEELPKGSFEDLLNEIGYNYSFVDFKSVPEKEKNEMYFTMYPTFYRPFKANWMNIYDGVFFTKEMKPSYYESYRWYKERNKK